MIEKKNNYFESLVYIIMCVCSFGAIWVTRIVITMAIRKALDNNKDEKSNPKS